MTEYCEHCEQYTERKRTPQGRTYCKACKRLDPNQPKPQGVR